MTSTTAITQELPILRSARTPSESIWEIDPGHAQIEFAVRHLMVSTVRGRFTDVQGWIRMDEAQPERSSVRVVIGAGSLDTRVKERDDHLRSVDFLEVARFPTITFNSTAVEARGVDHFAITGNLTIRGVTRQVVLDAEFAGIVNDPWGGTRAGFSATTKINRKDFGLTWNVALETGGVVVGDEVKISLEFEAIKQAASVGELLAA